MPNDENVVEALVADTFRIGYAQSGAGEQAVILQFRESGNEDSEAMEELVNVAIKTKDYGVFLQAVIEGAKHLLKTDQEGGGANDGEPDGNAKG